MSTYKEIKGFKVQTLATDTAASAVAGGSWSAGGNMNTARSEIGGGGTQTSGMAAGGRNATLINNNAEIYNGSSWTAIATMNTAARGRLGAGADNEAFIAIGGNPSLVNTENWNGSSWTEVNDLNTTKHDAHGNVGTVTAAIAVGYGSPNTTNEIWDGTNWTEVGDLNTGGGNIAFFGTSTSGIVAGGNRPAQVTICESWNGSSWTEVADLNQPREGGSGAGSSNSIGIVFGGYKDGTGDLAQTESWNGSAWTEVNDLGTARFGAGGAGSETSALCSGGRGADAYQAATEEWTASSVFTKINLGQVYYNSGSNAFKVTKQPVPGGSWASGGTMNTSRKMQMGFGIQTANIMAGGAIPPPASTDVTEQYNGSSWSEIAEINTARQNGKGAGTVTAGLVFGGYASPPGSGTGANEAWNGSAWTEVGDLSRSGGYQSFGTAGASSTSAIIFAGEPGTLTITETWNGTSWTEVADLNSGRSSTAGFGETTAAICVSGYAPSGGSYPTIANVESFDGTSWTEINDVNTSRGGGAGGSGSSTSGLFFGGQSPAGQHALTETFNGTSFTEVGDLSGPIYEMGYAPLGASSQSNLAGMSAGGKSPSPGSVAVTEEWTIPESISNLTITD